MSAISVLHAPRDEAFSERLANALAREGHATQRLSSENEAGDLALHDDAFIVIWSNAALKLARIQERAKEAMAQGKLIPVAVGGARPPSGFDGLPPVDLSGWSGDEADPRWQFVLDEVKLSAQRGQMEDSDPWEQQENFQEETVEAFAPVDESALPTDEVTHFGEQSEVYTETTDDVADGVQAAPQFEGVSRNTPYGNAGSKPALSVQFNLGPPAEPPAPLEYRTPPAAALKQPGFQMSPLKAALAGSALLIVLTGVAAVLAPMMVGNSNTVQVVDASSPVAERPPASNPQETNETVLASNETSEAGLTITSDGAIAAETPEVTQSEATDNIVVAELDVAEGAQAIAGAPAAPEETEAATLTEPRIADRAEDEIALADAEENSAAEDMLPSVQEPTLASSEDALGSLVASVTDETEAEAEEEPAAAILESAVEVRQASPSARFFKECADCPEMAAISTGVFLMGSPLGERSRQDVEGPQLMVGISSRYAIGTREVTFAQWDACVADGGCAAHRPSDQGWGRANQPVINVSFEDAQNYTRWLSAKTGAAYRLPSEAEWEYAARAGSEQAFAFGGRITTDQANFNGNYPYGGGEGEYRRRTSPVAALAPNAFGLFDMHGNVWEWTADCWYGSHVGASVDGTPRDGACATRVLKGGAWNTGGWRLRSAHRIGKTQSAREFDNGFRVVRELN